MSLVQPSIGKFGTIDHTLIVTKDIANVMNGNAQISEGIPQINQLFNTTSASAKLSPIGCCLSCLLLLGVPHNGGLISKVNATGNCLAR